MRLIAVYGSLRKGHYNHARFGLAEPLATHTLKGFNLYSLGPYPAIYPGEGQVVVDFLLVDENLFHVLDNMEKGAGYIRHTVPIDTINEEHEWDKREWNFDPNISLPVEIHYWVYNRALPEEWLVPSGDWNDRQDQNAH